jgi:predicted site-specific integrase-resolvase
MNQLLKKKQVAEILQISLRTLERVMKLGNIKYVQINNQPRFQQEHITEYLNKNLKNE